MTASPKRIVLAARPHGEPKPSDFRLEDYAMPELGEGQVLLRTIWLSLDPYMRGRMNDAASYSAPVAIDAVVEGGQGRGHGRRRVPLDQHRVGLDLLEHLTESLDDG